jgi:hypothetical protein
MAKNDRMLLDGILDDRVVNAIPSAKRDEVFEYLAFEQVLKEFDFSSDEILSGCLDGRGDGGIDGFFIIVNGHLLDDPEGFVWPRTGSDLRVVLVTAKHHDTFRQASLDAVIATLTELLDFAVDESKLAGSYSTALLTKRRNLLYAYRKLSPRLTTFSVSVVYASRGDTTQLGSEVASRAEQLRELIADCFGACKAEVAFLGASELVALHRKVPNYTLELPFVEALAKGERYVVLVRLSDYYAFVSDGGRLRRYLFESNVRDFMGLNRVNEDIRATLENGQSPDFWLLNNGVTILASSAAITGKSIQATDVQIVNGLQTTESIFRHFQSATLQDDRCLLVKVIVSNDAAVRDAIIRATNNQTDVELASLHATDKIQRDIEDTLRRYGLFYERRRNFYFNQGYASSEMVTPLYIASGYVALVLKAPHSASRLKNKFMRSPEAYERVFSERTPLQVWPAIAKILKRVDAGLEAIRSQAGTTDRFLKGWRYIVAFLLVSRGMGGFTYTLEELSEFDTEQVTAAAVEEVWRELTGVLVLAETSSWTSSKSVRLACEIFGAAHGLQDGHKAVRSHLTLPNKPGPRKPVSDDLVERVRRSLPSQPWKPKMHLQIIRTVKCSNADYFEAVERLIEEGVFLRQRDGVLYDTSGNVVAFDEDRVDPETLQLLPD